MNTYYPKFKINDDVWFMHDSQPCHGQVEMIKMHVFSRECDELPKFVLGQSVDSKGEYYNVEVEGLKEDSISIYYDVKFFTDGDVLSRAFSSKDLYESKDMLRIAIFGQ